MEWEQKEDPLVRLNGIKQVSLFDEEMIFHLPGRDEYFGVTGCGAQLVEFLMENQEGLSLSQLMALFAERLDPEIPWEEFLGNAVRQLEGIGAVNVR